MRKTIAILALSGISLIVFAVPAQGQATTTTPQYPGITSTTSQATTTSTPVGETTAAPTTAAATPTTVSGAAAAGAGLPRTGSDAVPLAQAGFFLLTAGAVILMALRRRSTTA